jgi:hypothetical protein
MDDPSIRLVDEQIGLSAIREMAEQRFGDMVKGVVDVDRRVMALGAELHADEEAFLLEHGSMQAAVWGINLYPDEFSTDGWLEFDSMINVRPSQSNRSRTVEDPAVRERIRDIVDRLVNDD